MMDANKILQVDALDLIFEGRNKEYGAYELRTNYRKRLVIAVGSMLLLCGCMILLNSFTGKSDKKPQMYVVNDIIMDDIKMKEKQPQMPPVQLPPPKQQILTIKNVVPVIAPDKDVKPEDVPPTVDEMTDVKIGTVNKDGIKGDDIVAPPNTGEETGVIEAPVKKEASEPDIYLTVQIESEYPGGISAWLRFLNKTLPKYYTDDLVEQEIQGRVVVQFVVDTEGNVSDVRGIEGPKELTEAAEKVIRLSGKWTPAIQNGHKVKSYKRQPIIFQLPQE
jgi:periplasmic protein TonB